MTLPTMLQILFLELVLGCQVVRSQNDPKCIWTGSCLFPGVVYR